MLVAPKVASVSACHDVACRPGKKMLKASIAFQQALKARPCARSAHFTVHYVRAASWLESHPKPSRPKLSTGHQPLPLEPVDNFYLAPPVAQFSSPVIELGMVVPKRLARRAVTRNLVKRHIRTAFAKAHQCGLIMPGTWVCKLRQPINKPQFISAKSDLIVQMLREELHELLQCAQYRAAAQPN